MAPSINSISKPLESNPITLVETNDHGFTSSDVSQAASTYGTPSPSTHAHAHNRDFDFQQHPYYNSNSDDGLVQAADEPVENPAIRSRIIGLVAEANRLSDDGNFLKAADRLVQASVLASNNRTNVATDSLVNTSINNLGEQLIAEGKSLESSNLEQALLRYQTAATLFGRSKNTPKSQEANALFLKHPQNISTALLSTLPSARYNLRENKLDAAIGLYSTAYTILNNNDHAQEAQKVLEEVCREFAQRNIVLSPDDARAVLLNQKEFASFKPRTSSPLTTETTVVEPELNTEDLRLSLEVRTFINQEFSMQLSDQASLTDLRNGLESTRGFAELENMIREWPVQERAIALAAFRYQRTYHLERGQAEGTFRFQPITISRHIDRYAESLVQPENKAEKTEMITRRETRNREVQALGRTLGR